MVGLMTLGSGGSFITVFAGLWSPGRDGFHSIILRRLLTDFFRLVSICTALIGRLFTGLASSLTERCRASLLAPEEEDGSASRRVYFERKTVHTRGGVPTLSAEYASVTGLDLGRTHMLNFISNGQQVLNPDPYWDRSSLKIQRNFHGSISARLHVELIISSGLDQQGNSSSSGNHLAITIWFWTYMITPGFQPFD
ncbi:hypothetical protein YC2023_057511 [Brassica napus]